MKKAVTKKAIATVLTIGFLSTGSAFATDAPAPQPETTTAPETTSPPNKNFGFDLALGVEAMGGDTTYSIGGPVTFADGSVENIHFPLSELEWPLDIWLARLDATVNIGSSWRINGVIKKNISDPDDPMKDSDWLDSPSSLDVYSESNISDFDALIWDVDVEWVFLERPSWNLFAGVGYQYQDFDYDSALIHQSSPSGLPGFEFYGDGSVSITYDVTYQMPYFLIGTDFQVTPNFIVSGSFSYSPWVDAEDEDNHVLRGIIAKGDMDGYAYMIDISGTYSFATSWFVEAGFHYTKIDVDGEQKNWSDGIYLWTTYEESESSQTSGYFKVGYNF